MQPPRIWLCQAAGGAPSRGRRRRRFGGGPSHGVENINAVSMKSMASTDSDETTTVRVVA